MFKLRRSGSLAKQRRQRCCLQNSAVYHLTVLTKRQPSGKNEIAMSTPNSFMHLRLFSDDHGRISSGNPYTQAPSYRIDSALSRGSYSGVHRSSCACGAAAVEIQGQYVEPSFILGGEIAGLTVVTGVSDMLVLSLTY